MPLIQCPKCKKEVSSKADSCPDCELFLAGNEINTWLYVAYRGYGPLYKLGHSANPRRQMYEHRSKWGSDMVYVAARAYRSKNFARRAEEAIRNVYWDCQSPEPGQREWYILEDIQAKALIEFVTLDEPLDPNLEPFSFLRHGKRKPY